ncbi:MAG: potassium channel family protein [Woeseia sp.]|nr:potassium channel family protein [Woeseia sp.]
MPWEYSATIAATAAAVIACVMLHYEGLRLLNRSLPLPYEKHRARVVLLILGLISLHIMEIWIFGAGYFLLLGSGDYGTLEGSDAMSLLDCVYFSATVFSTLGFGDITPKGAIRFMTGTEAIAGLTLITWSASYTFLFMQKIWKFDEHE